MANWALVLMITVRGSQFPKLVFFAFKQVFFETLIGVLLLATDDFIAKYAISLIGGEILRKMMTGEMVNRRGTVWLQIFRTIFAFHDS